MLIISDEHSQQVCDLKSVMCLCTCMHHEGVCVYVCVSVCVCVCMCV